jgi:uncharacterized protein YndB with AHSA1/START domain
VAENTIVIDASAERVYDVLAEPASFADWVVGARSVRDADETWPSPGSRLHHSTGVGPLSIDDSTEVVEAERPRRLVLRAHLGPLGAFHVELVLDPVGEGRTRVTLVEHPVEGVSRLAGPVGDAAGRVRNAFSLRRLKDLSER